MKKLNSFDYWNGTYEYKPNKKFVRVSRWITIKQNYNPTKRNALWDYVQDGYGYHPYQEKFNPEEGLFLDYFEFDGRTYALEQFIAIGSIADSIGHAEGYIENGKRHNLNGYDANDYFYPLFIELDEYGERVRCYRMEVA